MDIYDTANFKINQTGQAIEQYCTQMPMKSMVYKVGI